MEVDLETATSMGAEEDDREDHLTTLVFLTKFAPRSTPRQPTPAPPGPRQLCVGDRKLPVTFCIPSLSRNLKSGFHITVLFVFLDFSVCYPRS